MGRRPFRNDPRTRGLGCSPFQGRNRNMPSRLTLAQIEDMLARDEAQLEAYRHAAVEAEADGLDPDHTHGLARFVEERIDLVHPARAQRLPAPPPARPPDPP